VTAAGQRLDRIARHGALRPEEPPDHPRLWFAPLEVVDGREKVGLDASSEDLDAAGDQTAPLATIRANSGATSATTVLRALAQLSETMIMLASEGEMGHAQAVHEAIGRLLTPSIEPPEVRSCQRCETLKIGVALQADIR
jgi:hypothetical protein